MNRGEPMITSLIANQTRPNFDLPPWNRFETTRSTLGTRCWQELLSLPSGLAFHLTTTPWVEARLLYPRFQQYLTTQATALPVLPAGDRAIVTDLCQQGISVSSLAQLGLADAAPFLAAAQTLAQELQRLSMQPPNHRKHTLTATADQMLRYPEIFQWGVQDRLLAIAAAYLQTPVGYDAFSYYYSVANGQNRGPRKWHRDKEDWRMIKVAVYLNDVNVAGGPFECLHPEVNDRLRQVVPPYQVLSHAELTTHLTQLYPNVPLESLYTSVTGAAGTIVFTDVAHFYHRGKPPHDRDRAAVFFSYFSDRPKNPFFCGRSPLSQAQLRQLAQNLPEHQQRAVLWKDHLPGIGRWIPKNRVTV